MAAIQRADWVTCPGSSFVGTVQRVSKDGTWADVNWGSHSKRMNTAVLTVQHTIPFLPLGEGWTVTDETRKKELAAH